MHHLLYELVRTTTIIGLHNTLHTDFVITDFWASTVLYLWHLKGKTHDYSWHLLLCCIADHFLSSELWIILAEPVFDKEFDKDLCPFNFFCLALLHWWFMVVLMGMKTWVLQDRTLFLVFFARTRTNHTTWCFVKAMHWRVNSLTSNGLSLVCISLLHLIIFLLVLSNRYSDLCF